MIDVSTKNKWDSTLSLYINDVPSISVYLENKTTSFSQKATKEEVEIKVLQKVYELEEEKKFELNSIGLNNNTLSDSISQYIMGQSQKNLFFNNNTQILLTGKAYAGDYTVDMNTYNYKGELFSFGGLGFNYKNKFKNFEYEIGKPTGIVEKNYTTGTQLLGAQIRNYTSKEEKELKKGEKRYDVILGASGYNNRLFTQNNYIYELNTKKAVLGTQFQYGIKDNIKLDSKLFADRIYQQPKNSIWQSFYSSDALLTSGTWKNPNNLDGVTNFNTIYLQKNDSLIYKLTGGVSAARDLSLGENELFGYTVSAGGKLKRKFGNIEAELFNTSPDFYFAGSSGSFINDRLGGGITFDFSKNGINLFAQYKKYFSNTNYKFEGGLIDFNDYNFGINKNFAKFANVRFNITGRNGQNNLAENKSCYYDLNISKQLSSNLYLEGGKTESNYQTNYKEENDYCLNLWLLPLH